MPELVSLSVSFLIYKSLVDTCGVPTVLWPGDVFWHDIQRRSEVGLEVASLTQCIVTEEAATIVLRKNNKK
jgi:hypothetical protein